MIGELVGIGSALTWGLVSVVYAAMTARIDPLTMNFWRCLSAGVFIWMLLPFWLTGGFPALPPLAIAALFGSVVSSLIIGDTLYFQSLGMIGVARALPITNVYPLLSAVLAIVVLGEVLDWFTVAGIVAVLVGVYVIVYPQTRLLSGQKNLPEKSLWRGVALALAASALWALSITLLKVSLEGVDPLVANSVRLPLAALLILITLAARRQFPHPLKHGWKTLLILIGTGVIGTGVGGLFFLIAVSLAGAAKTATLVSVSPLFATPVSALFLRERITVEVAAGSALTIVGIALIML